MWPKLIAYLAEKKIGIKFAKSAGKKAAGKVFNGVEKFGKFFNDKTRGFIIDQGFKEFPDPYTHVPPKGFDKAKNIAAKTANVYLYPTNKIKAFASGFVGGATRQAALHGLDAGVDLLLGIPKHISRAPETSAFIRAFAGEARKLGGGKIKVNSASNLKKAWKTARRSAYKNSKIPSPVISAFDKEVLSEEFISEHMKYMTGLRRSERAGHIGGRVTVAGTTYYVMADEDSKEKRQKQFVESIKPWAYKELENRAHRARGQTRVGGYTKADGTRVQGYYRSV